MDSSTARSGIECALDDGTERALEAGDRVFGDPKANWTMKLPESPEDDRARAEALKRIGVRTAVAAAPITLIALLAYGLGLPWWIVAVAVAGALYLVLFET